MLAFIAVHKLYLAAKRQLYKDRFIQIKKKLFFYAANTKLCSKVDI